MTFCIEILWFLRKAVVYGLLYHDNYHNKSQYIFTFKNYKQIILLFNSPISTNQTPITLIFCQMFHRYMTPQRTQSLTMPLNLSAQSWLIATTLRSESPAVPNWSAFWAAVNTIGRKNGAKRSITGRIWKSNAFYKS